MGDWNGKHMVSCFDLAKEVVAPNLFETDLDFVARTVDMSSRKDNRAGTILEAAEN